MYIVHVNINVKAAELESFIEATIENARNSVEEPGVVRFDFIQNVDDPTNFQLVEIYRTPEDADKHKETAHYLKWRDTASPMMAEPRTRKIYKNLFPPDDGWR